MKQKILLAMVMALGLTACMNQPSKPANATSNQPAPVKPAAKPADTKPSETKAEDLLASGIKKYDDGDYKNAAKLIQSSLNSGLPSKAAQTKAYKYLAFINCINSKEKTCRDMFKKALSIDPKFSLTPTEAGHPVWGPIFKNAKAESTKAEPAK